MSGFGRDAALRRHRPRLADGIANNCETRLTGIAPLNAARTARAPFLPKRDTGNPAFEQTKSGYSTVSGAGQPGRQIA